MIGQHIQKIWVMINSDILVQLWCIFFQAPHLEKQWAGLVQAPSSLQVWDTGMDTKTLQYLGAKSVEVPENFVSIYSTFLSFFISSMPYYWIGTSTSIFLCFVMDSLTYCLPSSSTFDSFHWWRPLKPLPQSSLHEVTLFLISMPSQSTPFLPFHPSIYCYSHVKS